MSIVFEAQGAADVGWDVVLDPDFIESHFHQNQEYHDQSSRDQKAMSGPHLASQLAGELCVLFR